MKKKITTIVGARPQFIKTALLSRILRHSMREVLVHTGQHYDENMSKVFFDQLDIPRPDVDLDVGSGSHAVQTGLILERLEAVLVREKPDGVLLYGDTNSTLAGALAAVKLCIPTAHVEAGLRSYNKDMPEEINRIVADRCSDLLFCPTQTAVDNLKKEGMENGVHLTGDVMLDAAIHYGRESEQSSRILDALGLKPKQYLLCTVHRAENTDDISRLTSILEALSETDERIVFPTHPRTRAFMKTHGLSERIERANNVQLIDPVGYLDMVALEKQAKKILTDSGGVQKEAYFYRVPCITLRNETEWIETTEDGWNLVVGTDPRRILHAIRTFSPNTEPTRWFGDGNASERIAELIVKKF